MTEEAKKFRSKYYYVPRRTTLPYDINEVLQDKFQGIIKIKKIQLETKKDGDIEK